MADADFAFSDTGTSPSTVMADRDLCIAVLEDLARHYPGHPWLITADVQAGSVVIDLGYEKPIALRNFAYLLHASTLMGPGGQVRVMQAAGELLERFGVARGPGRADTAIAAADHGLTADDTAEGAWHLRRAGMRT
jgi:hypothetical protein